MKIRIRQNGLLSEWTPFSAKGLPELVKFNPESVIIRIDEFYEDSPDTRREVEIEFDLFIVLAVDFAREGYRRKKREQRWRKLWGLYTVHYQGDIPGGNTEDDYFQMLFRQEFQQLLSGLTEKERRRFSIANNCSSCAFRFA